MVLFFEGNILTLLDPQDLRQLSIAR